MTSPTEHTAVALAKIQAASAAPRDRHTRVLAYETAKLPDEIITCELCESDEFRIIYDRQAQGCHVECRHCGTVCLAVRSA